MQETPFSANVDAERGLLGLIMWHNKAFNDVASYLETEDFYSDIHKKIYSAMQHLAEKHASLDPIAVSEVLERRGTEDTLSYLLQIQSTEIERIDFDPVAVRAETYATVIAQHAENTRLAKAALHILEIARAGVEDATEQAESLIMGVKKRRKRQDFMTVGEYFPQYLNRLEKLYKGKDNTRGIPTGYEDLDRVLGGLQAGDLIIPAARPGIGKTTIMQNFAYNAALKHHKRIGFFSLEMNTDSLMDRFVSMHSKINSQVLRTGDLSEAEYDLLVGDVLNTFEKLGIWINHNPGINIDQLKSMARRLVAQHNIDMLMVDYIGLLQATVSGKRITPRNEEIAEIARQLKALAGELNVPIVAPAQINRMIDLRAGVEEHDEDGTKLTYRMPVLSDLKESGELEQSADVVLFLARAEEKEERVKVDIAKHRMGDTGEIDLYFVGSETRFYSLG